MALVALSTKRCRVCGIVKPVESFRQYAHKQMGRKVLRANCADCDLVYYAKYREANREVRNDYAREYARVRRKNIDGRRMYLKNRLKQSFGLTLERFDEMMREQGGVCAICKKPEEVKKRNGVLSVDHDHETGMVRGLLCHGCNAMLGMAKDSAERLRAAAEYLERLKG